MAEVYLIGQIHRAENFVEPNLFCKYSIQAGKLRKDLPGFWFFYVDYSSVLYRFTLEVC